MTDTPTTWAALRDKKDQLIRKALEGSVFMAPIATAAITKITTGAESALLALPVGYTDLGWLTTDGAQFARAVDKSDINSWGSSEPTRSDITNDTETLQVACQETRLSNIGLYMGVDVSGVLADAVTGEVGIAAPATPPPLFYRVLTLSVDIGDGGEIYIAKFYPRAQVTDFDDQKQANGDDPITYGVTFTAKLDSVVGYSRKNFWGGPGWLALLDDMGITQDS